VHRPRPCAAAVAFTAQSAVPQVTQLLKLGGSAALAAVAGLLNAAVGRRGTHLGATVTHVCWQARRIIELAAPADVWQDITSPCAAARAELCPVELHVRAPAVASQLPATASF